MRSDHLVLIARARWHLAFVLFLLAAVLSVWLMGASNTPPPMFCGNASVMVDSTMTQRWERWDPLRTAPLAGRLGRPLDLDRGEQLFKANCAACHKPDKDLTGPALRGIVERAPQPALEWIHAFLTNEDSLLRAGDAYTLAVRKAWGNYPWRHNHRDLTMDDTANLIAWIELYESHRTH